MTDAENNSKVDGLNNSQRDAFDHVIQYSRACHQYYMRERITAQCMHACGAHQCCSIQH